MIGTGNDEMEECEQPKVQPDGDLRKARNWRRTTATNQTVVSPPGDIRCAGSCATCASASRGRIPFGASATLKFLTCSWRGAASSPAQVKVH